MSTKFIFVTGGVVSAVGKGVSVASIGRILKSRGITVSVIKLDPYLNVDPGTMSPYQHGEVFVTKDGGETDMDLGHYERFIDIEVTRSSNLTAGQVYQSLIAKERRGDFLGGTIQAVSHVTNEIKGRILSLAEESAADVVTRGIRRVALLVANETQEDFPGFEIDETAPEAVVVGDLGDDWNVHTPRLSLAPWRGGSRGPSEEPLLETTG